MHASKKPDNGRELLIPGQRPRGLTVLSQPRATIHIDFLARNADRLIGAWEPTGRCDIGMAVFCFEALALRQIGVGDAQ